MARLRVKASGERVVESLRAQCRPFAALLGAPGDGEGGALLFRRADACPVDVRVRYREERKFLGRIYLMAVEADVRTARAPEGAGAAELVFQGFFSRQRPFFRPTGPRTREAAALAAVLNADGALLAACRDLDLGSLRVLLRPERGACAIELLPYGGSFVWLSFPPARYSVALPEAQAQAILHTVARLAHVLDHAFGADETRGERAPGDVRGACTASVHFGMPVDRSLAPEQNEPAWQRPWPRDEPDAVRKPWT